MGLISTLGELFSGKAVTDWGSAVGDLVQIGGGLWGQDEISDANQRAADTIANLSGQAGDILGKAYDDAELARLASLDTTGAYTLPRYDALTGLGLDVGELGASQLEQAVAEYVRQMGGDVDAFAQTKRAGAERYRADLAGLDQELAALLQPYAAGGESGLSVLQRIVAEDPANFTLSQGRPMDDAKRDATARLAASGLRGAGRAVTASLNDVEGGLRAKFLDQNQQRVDSAARALATMGYGATTKTADTSRALGAAAAGAGLDTEDAIAKAGLAAGMTGGQAQLQTARDAGAIRRQSYNDVVGQTEKLFDRTLMDAATRGDIRAGTVLGKAQAQAGALTQGGMAQANANIANAQGWGGTAGMLASIIADDSRRYRTTGQPSTSNNNTNNRNPSSTTGTGNLWNIVLLPVPPGRQPSWGGPK
jgi:hypothetical protein